MYTHILYYIIYILYFILNVPLNNWCYAISYQFLPFFLNKRIENHHLFNRPIEFSLIIYIYNLNQNATVLINYMRDAFFNAKTRLKKKESSNYEDGHDP